MRLQQYGSAKRAGCHARRAGRAQRVRARGELDAERARAADRARVLYHYYYCVGGKDDGELRDGAAPSEHVP